EEGVVRWWARVEQRKAPASFARVSLIECLDRMTRSVENCRVARLGFGRGIAKVAEDCKVDVRIEIADGLNFEMLSQRGGGFDAVQDRRHDDHRSRIRGNRAIFD